MYDDHVDYIVETTRHCRHESPSGLRHGDKQHGKSKEGAKMQRFTFMVARMRMVFVRRYGGIGQVWSGLISLPLAHTQNTGYAR